MNVSVCDGKNNLIFKSEIITKCVSRVSQMIKLIYITFFLLSLSNGYCDNYNEKPIDIE